MSCPDTCAVLTGGGSHPEASVKSGKSSRKGQMREYIAVVQNELWEYFDTKNPATVRDLRRA